MQVVSVILLLSVICLTTCENDTSPASSYPISCYMCDSEIDKNCQDPFSPDESLKPKPCNNGETFCRKITQKGKQKLIKGALSFF